MSENPKPKVTNPKVYESIDGVVPFCPCCGAKFVEPLAANYDYVCPAYKNSFNVGTKPKQEYEEQIILS